MDRHDATEQDARAMRLGVNNLMAMAREWELMFEWIEAAQRWTPVSVEKFNPGAKSSMEEKLKAADLSAAAIGHTVADFRAKIAAVRAMIAAANVYVAPEPVEPICVPQKEPEAVKDPGQVLPFHSRRKWHEMQDRPYGSYAEYYEEREYDPENKDGRFQLWQGPNYHDLIWKKDITADVALKAATEATALLKRQNELQEKEANAHKATALLKRQNELQEKEANAHKAARAAEAAEEKEAPHKAARAAETAKEKEARVAPSRKSRDSGYYSLLQDAGSRQDHNYSAVREQEARNKEADKKWEEESDKRARVRQAEEEAEEARVNERVKKRGEERDERARQAEKILAEQQRIDGIRADARARDAREKEAMDRETPTERNTRLALWEKQRYG